MSYRNNGVKEEFYVPARIKTGKSRTQGYTAITFKNSNGAWLQPSYFQRVSGFPCIDKPRDTELTVRRDISNAVQYRTNEPVSGFRFDNISQYLDDDSPVWINDPRGWQFKILMPRFHKWLNKGITIGENGVIGGSWVYACEPSTREILILNTEWPEYEAAIKEEDLTRVTEFIKTTMKKKNLEVGKVYRIYNSRDLHDDSYCRAIYLGEWKFIPDMKKFSRFLMNVKSTGWGMERDHRLGDKYRAEILSKLEMPKMVFLKLKDMCKSNMIKYDGAKFMFDDSYSTNKDLGLTWIDQVVPGHDEFSICFDEHNSDESCLYVASALDNMIVRGLDPNQEYKVIEDWMKRIPSKYRGGLAQCHPRFECFQGYDIMNHLSYDNIHADMWHYSTYTIGEINNFVNHLVQARLLPLLRNPPYGVKKDRY